ncbi:MAG: hypothetical protein WD080_04085 [Egibacteraceae bacterium]
MPPQLTPSDRTYRNTTIRITELAVTDAVLRGLTFESCHIMGPAVLAVLDGVTMNGCTYDVANNDLDSVIWEIETGRWVVGAIGIESCEFYGCRFTNIGLAMPPELSAQFREVVAGPD